MRLERFHLPRGDPLSPQEPADEVIELLAPHEAVGSQAHEADDDDAEREAGKPEELRQLHAEDLGPPSTARISSIPTEITAQPTKPPVTERMPPRISMARVRNTEWK